MSLITKSGVHSSYKSKLEFLSIVLMIAVSVALYVSSQISYASVSSLFKHYVHSTYGDVLIVGYVPSIVDELMRQFKVVKDFTGFVVVPAYGVDSRGHVRPVLLGYTEAAYRNNTLLGGFKASNLKEGYSLLLREGSDDLHVGMRIEVYPTIALNGQAVFNLTIVGYVEGGLPLPAGPVIFLSKEDGKRLLESVGGYTVYSVVLKNGVNIEKALHEITRLIKEAGGYIGFTFVTKRDLRFYPGQGIIMETVNGIEFVSLLSWSVITVMLLIFSIMYIEKNVREIATFRSIGATVSELSKYVAALWGTRLLIGVILGIAVGAALSKLVIASALSNPRLQPFQNFVKLVIPMQTFSIPILLSALTLALILLVSIVASYRIKLVEALTFYGIKFRLREESRLPFFLIIAISELRTLPWRNLAAIVLLSLGVALIALPFTLSSSLHSFHEEKMYDVKTIMMIIPHISPSLNYFLKNVNWSDAKEVAVWIESLYGSVNMRVDLVRGKDVPVYAISCVLPIKGRCVDFLHLVKGRWIKLPNETVVSSLFAYKYNVKVGDEILIKLRIKENVEKILKLRVVGIFDSREYPPTLVLSPKLLPPVNEFKVFTILVKTDHPIKMSNYLRSFLVSNAYAAVSMTWEEHVKELAHNLSFVAESLKTTALSSYAITTLGILSFVTSDLSVRRKIWMIFRSLGLTSLDMSLALFFRWLVIAILSVPLTLVLLDAWTAQGIGVLSQVYLLEGVGVDFRFGLLDLLAPVFIFLVALVYFKYYKPIEELKNA